MEVVEKLNGTQAGRIQVLNETKDEVYQKINIFTLKVNKMVAKTIETKLEKEDKVFNVGRKPEPVFNNIIIGTVKMDLNEEVRKVEVPKVVFV